MSSRRGLLFIVSAPSGAGKTTVVRRMVARTTGIGISRSFTSRPVGPNETAGVDYDFVTAAQFAAMREAGAFLESADVFGDCYGTSAEATERRLASGEDLVLIIDVQGARQVRAQGVPHVGVFLLPPSFAVLEQRLRDRKRDSEEAIQRRLATARAEIEAYPEYEYLLVNDRLDECVDGLGAIVIAERARRAVMMAEARAIAETFAG